MQLLSCSVVCSVSCYLGGCIALASRVAPFQLSEWRHWGGGGGAGHKVFPCSTARGVFECKERLNCVCGLQ